MAQIKMNLDELIDEHEKLVRLLGKTIKTLQKEHDKQYNELQSYISIKNEKPQKKYVKRRK
jgi:hypothetical protein